MFTPNKKIHMAVLSVLYIACASSHGPVKSQAICEYLGITLRYLEHILQQLVRDGILRGVRGPKGGYVLARDRRKIALGDIHRSIVPLVANEELAEVDLNQRIVAPATRRLDEVVAGTLDEVTIQSLYEEAGALPVDIMANEKADFVI